MAIILVAIQSSSESILRFLSETREQNLKKIIRVIFINMKSQEKTLIFSQLEFKSKTRESLINKSSKLEHILFLEISSWPEYNSTKSSYLLQNLPINSLKIYTNQMWNIYKYFEDTKNLIKNANFQQLLNQYIIQKLYVLETKKEIDYFFRYKEEGVIKEFREFKQKKNCKESVQFITSNLREIKFRNQNCFKISFKSPTYHSLVLISKSELKLQTQQQQLIPFYFNSTYFLYFIEEIFFEILFVKNPTRSNVTIIHSKIAQFLQSDLVSQKYKKIYQVISQVNIIKLQLTHPLMICTNNTLYFPNKKEHCELLHHPLIIYQNMIQFEIAKAYDEYYTRQFQKFTFTHINLIFSNFILLNMNKYELHQVFFMILITLFIINEHFGTMVILLYSIFIFSISTLLMEILNKIIKLKNLLKIKRFLASFIISLPFLVIVCNVIGLHYSFNLWISLMLSHFIILNKKGQFIGFYLLYLSSDYVNSTEYNIHFIPIICWTCILHFNENLFIHEEQTIQKLNLGLAWLCVFFCNENLVIIHFIIQMYICGIIFVFLGFVMKKQRILRQIHNDY